MFNHRKFHAFSLYWSSTWYLLWCFFDGVTELPIYNHRETHYRLWMTVISNAHLLAHTENHMNNCWSGLAGGQKKKGGRQERRRARKGRKEKRGGRSGRGREGRKGVGEWRKKNFSRQTWPEPKLWPVHPPKPSIPNHPYLILKSNTVLRKY